MILKNFLIVTMLEGKNQSIRTKRRIHISNIGWYDSLGDHHMPSNMKLRTGENIIIEHTPDDIDKMIRDSLITKDIL